MLDKLIFGSLILYAFSSTLSLAAASVGLYGALLLAIILYIRKPFRISLDKGILYAITFFIITYSLSLINAYNSATTVWTLWNNCQRLFPMLLIPLFIKGRHKIYTLVFVMFLGIGISDAVAIWQGLHGNFRANAFVAHPIHLAGMIIQTIPFLLVLALQDHTLTKKVRYGLLFLTLLSSIALLFNGTRGAWIAIMVSLILYGLIYFRKKPKLVLSFILILCLLGSVIYCVPAIKNRFNSIDDLKTNSERLLIWQSAIHIFRDYSITGIGAGNFGPVYQKYYISPLAKEPKLNHAHNDYLHFLVETGIIGFLGFICFWGYLLYFMVKNYQKGSNPWALIGMLVIINWLVHGFTEYNFGAMVLMRMSWFQIGLVLAGLDLYFKNADEKVLC
jgi:O-antigen ligase